ncbi:MAG: hypothetical protein V4671_28200, partial [Armatimonadota bacterium]
VVSAIATTERKIEIEALAARAQGQTEREFRREVNGRGFILRVGRRNGRPQVGTRDFRRDRITVQIDNGIVVTAVIG